MLGVLLQVLTVTACLAALNWYLRKSLNKDTAEFALDYDEELCQLDETPLKDYRVRSHW